MFGNAVEFERLNMSERCRLGKTRDCFQGGSRTGTDDHVGAAQLTALSVTESDFHSLRCYEPSCSLDHPRSRVPVVCQVHVVEARDHLPFAIADARHVDCEAVLSDAKLLASAHV